MPLLVPAIPPAALLVLLVAYLPPAVVLSRIDAVQQRLPNPWVAGMTAAVTAGLLLASVADPSVRGSLRGALVIAVVLGLGAVLVALAAPPLLGMGDAKTVPVVMLMSTVLGGEVLIGAILGIAVLGGVVGAVVLIASGRAGQRFPFGPVLLAGPFLGLLASPLVAGALGSA